MRARYRRATRYRWILVERGSWDGLYAAEFDVSRPRQLFQQRTEQRRQAHRRHVGTDSLAVTFYRVDDLAGRIGALAPGEAGYAKAAQDHAYQLGGGGTLLGGPGYGNFSQSTLVNVGAGDIIAMLLQNQSIGATYWGFAKANETVNGQPVDHLWNYGLNTWGFEDQYDRGDRDYNDLLIQLDFTSSAGHGWLV